MSTRARIILSFLFLGLGLMVFMWHYAIAFSLLMVGLSLLILGTSGLMRRLLVLGSLWFLGSFAVWGFLVTLITSSGGGLDADRMLSVALVSSLLALIIVAGTVVIVIYAASELVLGLSGFLGVTRARAMRLLASAVFQLKYPYRIIEDGLAINASPGDTMSRFGGPGLLVVRPGSAAVLQQGGNISRIVGSGVFPTELFEIVKLAVDLRPQWECSDLQVATRDGAPIKISASFRYRVEVQGWTPNSRRSAPTAASAGVSGSSSGQSDHDQEAVRRAVFEAGPGGWRRATKRAVEAIFHDLISRMSLDELYGDPDVSDAVPTQTLRDIAEEVRRAAGRRTMEWGVRIESIDIVSFEAPKNVTDWAVIPWDTATESERILRRGKADAEVVKAVETVKLGARNRTLEDFWEYTARAVGKLSPSEVGNFLGLLEKLAVEMSRDRAVAFRYLQTLEAMSQNPEAKLILNTGDLDVVVGGLN